jgi:predicted NUDIX family NTP pyrophosphohydrolase
VQQSAGTLLFREGPRGVEVLLVHPSGNYNRRAPWSIPKGLVAAGEDLETTARRETLEETGISPGQLVSLSSIDYRKSRKRVHCFSGEVPADAVACCASWEVDKAEFMLLDEARQRIHPDQIPFLDRFVKWLESRDL